MRSSLRELECVLYFCCLFPNLDYQLVDKIVNKQEDQVKNDPRYRGSLNNNSTHIRRHMNRLPSRWPCTCTLTRMMKNLTLSPLKEVERRYSPWSSKIYSMKS